MNHEEYNNMINTFESCTPSECITKMFEMTDKDSLLCIPAWPYDNDEDQAGAYYTLRMNWTREDAEALIYEHARIVNVLSELAEKWKNNALGFTAEENQILLSDELFTVWNTYIHSLSPDDMDFMRFYDIAEKVEENPGEVTVSPEELRYYHEYIDRVYEEARHRLSGHFAQYDQIIRAQRLHKLMAQDAPQILIDNESRILAQTMAVGRFAEQMKLKKVRPV